VQIRDSWTGSTKKLNERKGTHSSNRGEPLA
jgi:hypothetical protein